MFLRKFSLISRLFLSIVTVLSLSVSPVFFAPKAQAASTDYAALLISVTGGNTLTMAPGERRQIITTWKNAGKATWVQEGNGYLSIYTQSPKYRRSVFDPGTWMGPTQLRPMEQKSVKPGEAATIIFDLHAPEKVGEYQETFQLAAEDRAWVDGGLFTLAITVKEKEKIAEAAKPIEAITVPPSGTLSFLSANEVRVKAGKPVMLTAVFQNTGVDFWQNYTLIQPDLQLASTQPTFAHPSWKGMEAASVLDAPVAPNEKATITFALLAPSTNGRYEARFKLKANGEEVKGAEFLLPVVVTGGAEAISASPILQTPLSPEASYPAEEPLIRIGVLIVDEETDEKVVITSAEAFSLHDTEGNILGEISAGGSVTAYYKDLRYYFDRGQGLETSTNPLRFIPATPTGVMKIANFDRRITRGDKHAFNLFRGTLELRYNDYKDRAWMINELPMDYYLRGLAETWDPDPMEYQKTMIIAARTYAYFHWLRGGNRAKEFMHLISTADDQVYKGYEREMQAPRILQAVEETRGMVVTANDQVAITPYFARSNGATKDWNKVWWGNQPHVKGVSVACDKGKTQWGHGVGLAASGALCMAKEGKTHEEILQYFYTGIVLKKWWK